MCIRDRGVPLALPDACRIVERLAVTQDDDPAPGAGRGCLGHDGSGGNGDVDQRAVPPQPVEGVELALLRVLDVDDDVAEVQEHPAACLLYTSRCV